MEQTKALNALEPFLALHKTATSPIAAADLVTRATSAPNTFLFSELLHTPSIQSLASSPDHASFLTLLQIFSYGTYADYRSTPGLPQLSSAQILKLRQLSLLTLARDRRNLTYEKLATALDLPSPRELENLVVTAVYAGLLDATLDPHRQVVQVNSVAPLRDLAPGAIPPMMEKLSAWSGRCTSTLADLEAEIQAIKDKATQRQKEKEEEEKETQRLMATLKEPSLEGIGKKSAAGAKSLRFGKRGPIDDGAEEAMDVDVEEDAGSKVRSSRRKL
ncbi:hypothetical protein jhhlp_004497 [Lomentospora prolificans]|uniref:PCI domain-containing protein n=1 Tax=Lomentospora prolificans TaxID=41688 RepID=A0A2N3NBQ6_9PEZI|nr:hypothetical protein jhhlp_004497 [Lomentospora prolificans]